jgi:hypothetical protein
MHMFARCPCCRDAHGFAIETAPHGGLGIVAVPWHAARSTARIVGTATQGARLRRDVWAVEYNRFAVKTGIT